jgi:hypothetical protein
MKSLLTSLGLLFGFLIILSITINDRTIFSYIYHQISPVTTQGQELVEGFLKRSIAGTKIYTKKIFDNSIPKIKDSVKSKMSSHQKIQDEVSSEHITFEEKNELDDLIKNH